MVSVIMAVYNAERHLQAAIESILGQTLTDLELIIINDGSTDNSAAIIRGFNDPRLVIVERENRGLAASLNEAIGLAKGRFIARMDADDVAAPERLSRQHEYLEGHPDIALVGSQGWRVSDDGEVLGEIHKPITPEQVDRHLQYACPIIHPTYFARSEVYRELVGYRTNLKATEDLEFLLRARSLGFRLANVPDKLLYYRVSPQGISQRHLKRQMVETRQLLESYRRYPYQFADLNIERMQTPKDTDAYDTWFLIIWNFRSSLVMTTQSQSGFNRASLMALATLLSCLHPEIFAYSKRALLAKRSE